MIDARVTGIDDLRRAAADAVDALEKTLPADLADAVAAIAADARTRIPSRTGRARGSIGSHVTDDGAELAAGGPAVPYYGWLDFGVRRPITGRARQVGPWTGTGPGPARGRAIYPAIDAADARLIAAGEAAVDRATGAAGL